MITIHFEEVILTAMLPREDDYREILTTDRGSVTRGHLDLYLRKHCLFKEEYLSSDLRSSADQQVDYISIAEGLVGYLQSLQTERIQFKAQVMRKP